MDITSSNYPTLFIFGEVVTGVSIVCSIFFIHLYFNLKSKPVIMKIMLSQAIADLAFEVGSLLSSTAPRSFGCFFSELITSMSKDVSSVSAALLGFYCYIKTVKGGDSFERNEKEYFRWMIIATIVQGVITAAFAANTSSIECELISPDSSILYLLEYYIIVFAGLAVTLYSYARILHFLSTTHIPVNGMAYSFIPLFTFLTWLTMFMNDWLHLNNNDNEFVGITHFLFARFLGIINFTISYFAIYRRCFDERRATTTEHLVHKNTSDQYSVALNWDKAHDFVV